MPLFGRGYTGPSEVHYLFVDGGYLRGRIETISRTFFQGKTFRLDFTGFANVFTKTFYYDAIPVREDGEHESDYLTRVRPQRELLDSAAAVDRVHVYEGDARRRRKVGLEQKKVDVMITV